MHRVLAAFAPSESNFLHVSSSMTSVVNHSTSLVFPGVTMGFLTLLQTLTMRVCFILAVTAAPRSSSSFARLYSACTLSLNVGSR